MSEGVRDCKKFGNHWVRVMALCIVSFKQLSVCTEDLRIPREINTSTPAEVQGLGPEWDWGGRGAGCWDASWREDSTRFRLPLKGPPSSCAVNGLTQTAGLEVESRSRSSNVIHRRCSLLMADMADSRGEGWGSDLHVTYTVMHTDRSKHPRHIHMNSGVQIDG